MKHTWLIAAVSAATFLSPLSFADNLKPFTATYEIHHENAVVGTNTKTLSYPSADQYLYISDTDIKVAFYHQHYVERSTGNRVSAGYQPTQYTLDTNGKITFESNQIAAGTQDSLSQGLMLSYLLLNNQKPTTLPVITATGTQNYSFTVVSDNEQSSTRLGTLPTTHIQFTDNEGNLVDEWLAKQYQYLPVIIQASKDGKISGIIYLVNVKE